MDWIETDTMKQAKKLEKWLDSVKRRSITVLEIGAGSAQPISKNFGE